MTDNRNTSSCFGQNGRGTVCIDTYRVLDSCRDRDCFDNTRVYLTSFGEEVISGATSVRARSAQIMYAYVGVDEVPFNCGFYQVTVRYYIVTELEACLGLGRSQTFKGLSVLEKQVILYGGEGSVVSFSSDPESSYCNINLCNKKTNAPIAVVETVEPIVLGTKINECACTCNNNDCIDLPDVIRTCLDGEVYINPEGARLYISFGVFSVIRIERPAQLLVEATDYSVPDKECVAATNDEDPCSVFRNMDFPIARFRGVNSVSTDNARQTRGGCCNK